MSGLCRLTTIEIYQTYDAPLQYKLDAQLGWIVDELDNNMNWSISA